jgi:hypothetical protein
MTVRFLVRHAPVLLVALLLSAAANAQILRAYVSSTGNDANPCNIAAPCRLLPAALNAVANGGEIWMLDSANFNTSTVTIAKSVSILAVPGAVGSVVAFSGPAISITASSLKVGLRNLVIVGLPGTGGTQGLNMTGASAVTIENSLIANLPQQAIYITGAGSVRIANSIIRDSGSGSFFAVEVNEGAKVELSGTQLLAPGLGIVAYTSTAVATKVTVSDSTISGCGQSLTANAAAAGATSKIAMTRSTIEGCTFGPATFASNGGTTEIALSGNMITNVSSAAYYIVTGGIVRSLGNNHIADSGAPIGSLTTTIPLQ